MDKIQMTEEQADNLVADCVLPEHREFVRKELKKLGYINQTALEIAKNGYYKFIPEYSTDVRIIEYIEELEKEVERLKGE